MKKFTVPDFAFGRIVEVVGCRRGSADAGGAARSDVGLRLMAAHG